MFLVQNERESVSFRCRVSKKCGSVLVKIYMVIGKYQSIIVQEHIHSNSPTIHDHCLFFCTTPYFFMSCLNQGEAG